MNEADTRYHLIDPQLRAKGYVMAEVDAIEASAKVALADIECLPSRVLAQAFNPQGDHHGR